MTNSLTSDEHERRLNEAALAEIAKRPPVSLQGIDDRYVLLTESERDALIRLTQTLSPLDRVEQQAGICRECKIERGYRPILDYVRLCPRHATMDDVATRMRDKCAAKLREDANVFYPHEEEIYDALNEAADELQSLTLDNGDTDAQSNG